MIDTSHRGLFFTATLIMCAACFYASDLARSAGDDAVEVAIAPARELTPTPILKSEDARIGASPHCVATDINDANGCNRTALDGKAARSNANLEPEEAGPPAASLGSATSY